MEATTAALMKGLFVLGGIAMVGYLTIVALVVVGLLFIAYKIASKF